MNAPAPHHARKRFGQNFLQDASVIQAIVRAVQPQPHDTVIEIGPGLGALTIPLSGSLERLHVIEIDRDLIARLEQSALAPKLVIHPGDVLEFDFGQILGRKKIVGNLPYNISTPLLLRLSTVEDVVSMHFMLQNEVVERMVAAPGSRDYGRLSVMLQYFFEMEKILDVPPQAFAPPPKVDSAVVQMLPAPGRIGRAENFEHFAALVKQAFSQRRKTLRNTLKNHATEADLTALGIDPQARAETLAPSVYVALSNALVARSAA